MRVNMRGFKNTILKFLTGQSVFWLIFSIFALDSDSWTPFIICVICMIWISLFFQANKEIIKKEICNGR